MKDRYYFAYGSNMNLEQMKYRCPAAEVVENVRLEDYRLAFRGKAPAVGGNTSTLGGRLAYAEMHRPRYRTIAAVQVVIVI